MKPGWCGATGGPEGPGDPPDEATSAEHEPVCPPESRCVICWVDDDAVIKALVTQRDKLRPIVEEFVTYAGGMEYDDWRMFVQRAQEALNP